MASFSERAATVRRTYEAFNQRDIDTVLATMDPDVDWPNMIDFVRVHGHAEVRAYWERQFRDIDPHVEPTEVIAHGDALVVAVHQVVRDLQGNLLSDSHIAHVYTFRGDLVATMFVHPSVDAAKEVDYSS
jgi:hypothetical protein